MTLTPGRFYRSHNGEIWCCYKVYGSAKPHMRASCVRTSDSRIECFFSDGRHDERGKREHTLVEDMSAFWESL